MKMKRIGVMILALLLLMAGTAGAEARNKEADGFFVRQALALTQRMDRMAEHGFARFMSGSPEIEEIAAAFAAHDYETPSQAIVLAVNGTKLLTLLTQEADMPADMPEDLMDLLRYRSMGALPNLLMGQSGVSHIAAASMLTTGESYLAPYEGFDGVVVYLAFEGAAYATMTSFVPSGEGIISASSTFVTAVDLIEQFSAGGLEAAAALGMAGVTMDPYQGSALTALLAED